jgi:hypothetical protein
VSHQKLYDFSRTQKLMTAMQSPKLQVAQRRRRQGPFRFGIMIAASEKLFSMVGVDVFLAEGMSEQSQR